ncbi:MAG: membrane protein insertase YidC [Gemmatimonadales bacterium]
MDRKLLIGLLLIFAIVYVPAVLLRRPQPKPPASAASRDSVKPDTEGPVAAPAPAVSPADSVTGSPPGETVVVRSTLYRYAISTLGGRIVSSRLLQYRSLAPATQHDTLELIPPGGGLLGGTVVVGTDTVNLDRVAFTASADSLDTTKQPATLTMHGTTGGYQIDLTYTFASSGYRIDATGRISGLPATGGTLLVGLGNGFQETEATAADNYGQSGIVTERDKTSFLAFAKLKPRIPTPISGPFEWAAVKSKYFVASLFAYDSTARVSTPRIGGVMAFAADTTPRPIRAHVAVSIAVPATGAFHWTMYLGPMEYNRLAAFGHRFDDVNPYGWAWLRPVVRPIAVVIRAIFVWMHTAMGLGYGLVIVIFGLLVRVLLWPLSRTAMRSMARMQAVQPQLTALQARYKENPQQLQQETFKLYKEHKVNPLGGCWPMLLPYPLLIAVFFVLAYTIEVRGVSFLWMSDLARADPLYITPLLMSASMYVVSRIGQMGLPPNPQAKMMTWMMPGIMLLLFARFASGLNLYYAVQNIASIPQQWLVMKERRMMQGKPAVVVARKK